MKTPTYVVLAAALAVISYCSAGEMKACSDTNMNGFCDSQISFGSRQGNWRSYNWRASINMCVKICKNCLELGWRCQDYSNNDLSFNKLVVFDWANGEGPHSTSCC
ncbi:hypothetical protein BKA57DRAFT_524319 [Linnemannia elongata]|nr:hypothetical protein BKA57DRAFT_524319 [Linnemannia elongata]